MIIWNWFLSKAFSSYRDNNNILIFASWVSNSQNKDFKEFQREIDLLEITLKENKDKLFIYFWTCSVLDNTLHESLYVKHKLNAENIIKNSWNNYLIFRISNPVWRTNNPNTIMNFLYNKILNWEEFDIWTHTKRNLIDIDDLLLICSELINSWNFINKIINIANPNYYSVKEIVSEFEKYLWKKWNYKEIDIWWIPKIDLTEIKNIIIKLNLKFNDNYLTNLIKKYY